MKTWMAFVVAIASMVLCTTVYGDRPKAWMDWDTAGVGVSYLFDVGEEGGWSVGPLVDWADNEDLDSDALWGLGVQVEMQVDPNAVVPIADWLGSTGDLLNLPETLTGRTYVIGEAKVINPFEGDMMGVLAAGPGVGVGPVYVEWVYQLAEGGAVDAPGVPGDLLTSGPMLRFGLAPFEF